MKKYRKRLTIALVIIVIITSSIISYQNVLKDFYAVNDYYQIYRENGKYHLLLTNYGATFRITSSPNICVYVVSEEEAPKFASVAEMKERFINGDFTKKEITYIADRGLAR